MGEDMKDSLARLGIKQGSVVAILIAFAILPLPGFEGNPTGFKYIHDHAAWGYLKNVIAISNTHEMTVAMDDRKGIQFQLWQLESLILQTNESEKLSHEKRESLIDRYERKVDRLEKRLDKKNDRIDGLMGAWSGYGIAQTEQ